MGWAVAHGARDIPWRHRELQLQLAAHGVVQALRRHAAIGKGLLQAALPHHAKGHLQILAGLQGLHAIADPEDEIAHHQPLKSPAPFEDLIQ